MSKGRTVIQRIVLVTVLLGGAALGKDGVKEGVTDGRWWSDLPKIEKVLYVTGAADGYIAGTMDTVTANAKPGQTFTGAMPTELAFGDIVNQMDKFYGDYKYTPVCRIDAFKEAFKSLQGHPATEEQLAKLRTDG